MARSGSALGATWLSLSLPALISSCEKTWQQVPEATGFQNLTDDEAADFAAFAAQIIPTTDTPGAEEAGVVYFADAAFGSFFAPMLPPVQNGLAAIRERVVETHGDGSTFAALSGDDQFAIMKAIESEPYFGLMRFVTLTGMFSNPEYGGNRDKAGWSIIGFDDRHVWQHPFGYYDEEYANAGQ